MTGTRGAVTGKALWKSMENKKIGKVATDYYQPYEAFVPNQIHTQSKAQTFTVEGYNSLPRHFLARMRKKTKCYSKCKKMLEYSIKLRMAKWNGKLHILS